MESDLLDIQTKLQKETDLVGEDSHGNSFTDLNDFWKNLVLEKGKQNWTSGNQEYWTADKATVDGMLGGYGRIDEVDTFFSGKVIDEFSKEFEMKFNRCLDCGAGIGRISKDVFVKRFENCDLVEINPVYVETAKKFIGSEKMKNFYTSSLQDFEPTEAYDLIWVQWVLGYLADDDLVKFFERCGENVLETGGVIFVKENVQSSGFYVDRDDNNLIRSV